MRPKAVSRLRTWISTSERSPPQLLLSVLLQFSCFILYHVFFFCFYSWLEGTRSRRQTPECAICYLKMAEVPLSAGRYGRSIRKEDDKSESGLISTVFDFDIHRSRRISLLCSLTFDSTSDG